MKSLLASRTFWFNVISALAVFFGNGSAFPASWLPTIALITAVINVILRMLTYEPVTTFGSFTPTE